MRPSSSCLPALLSFKTAEEVNEKMNNLKVEEWVPVRNGTFEDKLDSETPQSVDWRKHGLVSPVQNQVGCFKPTLGDRWHDNNDEWWIFPRAIVAPAGPSALWELWRVRWRGKLASWSPWVHRTWWTAAPVTGTSAAEEGTSPNPTTTSSATEAWTQRASILTNIRSSFHTHNPRACPRSVLQLQNNLSVLQKGKCRYSVKGKAGYCSRFHILPQGDEETLKATVTRVGPVAVAVNAMLPSFHFYRGGENGG